MAAYRLDPIPTMRTLRISLGNETVGYAYAPTAEGEPWEVLPKASRIDGLPDGDRGWKAREFASLEGVEAFLGIAREAQAA